MYDSGLKLSTISNYEVNFEHDNSDTVDTHSAVHNVGNVVQGIYFTYFIQKM